MITVRLIPARRRTSGVAAIAVAAVLVALLPAMPAEAATSTASTAGRETDSSRAQMQGDNDPKGPRPAPTQAPSCRPNDDSSIVQATGRRCIAGLNVPTRGEITASCITEGRALSPLNPEYEPGECKGGGYIGLQAEAIAQARLIAQVNFNIGRQTYQGPYSDNVVPGTGISPNIQWESIFPNTTRSVYGNEGVSPASWKSTVKPDFMLYNYRSTSLPVLSVAELKVDVPDGAGPVFAASQVAAYVTQLNSDQSQRAAAPLNQFDPALGQFAANKDGDDFRIVLRDCESTGDKVKVFKQYTTKAVAPGVILVRHSVQTEDCDEPSDSESAPGEVVVSEPVSPGVPVESGPSGPVTSSPPNPCATPRPGVYCPHKESWPVQWEHCVRDVVEGSTNAAEWVTQKTGQMISHGLNSVGAGGSVSSFAAEVATKTPPEGGLAPAETATGLGVGAAAAWAAAGAAAATAYGCAVDPNAFGDPHLVTLDGRTYDLQAAGEFHLVEDPATGLDIQGRFSPWVTNVSTVGAIALNVGDQRVEMHADGTILVDGENGVIPVDGAYRFDDGSVLLKNGTNRVLALRTANAFVRYDSGVFGFRSGGSKLTRGLLGDGDGNSRNDLKYADGTPLPDSASPGLIHGAFADSWRITNAESLFTYAAGESSDTFTNTSFPAGIIRTGDFPAEDIEIATSTCLAGSVQRGPQLDACVYDYLVSGDDRYVAAAAAVQGELFDPAAKEFDSSGSIDESFASPVASNFASPRYLTDPSTSRVAGPFFDGGAYTFYQVNTPRHDELDMTLRLVAYGAQSSSDPESVAVTLDNREPIVAQLDGQNPATTAGNSIQYVASGATVTGTEFRVYELSIPVAHFGTALRVQVMPHNFRGVLGTSLGVDSVHLSLITTPGDQFAVNTPLDLQATPELRAQGAGQLPTGGAADLYHLHLVADAARGLSVVPSDCAPGIGFRLVNDSTGAVELKKSNCERGQTRPLAAGDYTLEMSGGSGTYGLTVDDVPGPQQFAYSLGQKVSNGSIGGQGAQGAGNLETPASTDRYAFETMSSTRVLFARSSNCPSAHLISTDSGADLGDVCGAAREFLLPAGHYAIDVSARSGDPVGVYSFESFVLAVDQPQDSAVTTSGQALDVALGAGQSQGITLAAQALHRYRIWLSDADVWHSRLHLSVYSPDGTLLSSKDAGLNRSAFTTGQTYLDTPDAGNYRIVISPDDGSVAGTMTLRVKDVTDRIIPIATDGTAAVASLDVGERAVYTFNAIAGQRFRIWQSDQSFWHESLEIRVYAPDGSLLSDHDTGAGQNGLISGQSYLEPAESGTYKVVVSSPYDMTGSVAVHVQNATDIEQSPALDGSATPAEFVQGQNGSYVFDALAGQRFRIWLSDSSFWHENLRVRVYAPDGSLLNEQEAGDTLQGPLSAQYDIDPAVAGRYKVVIDPQGDASGSTKLHVKRTAADASAVVPTDGSPTTIELEERQNGTYSFDGVGGRRYRVWQTGYTFPYTDQMARIYAPDGTLLNETAVGQWANGVLNGQYYIDPSVTGRYKVVIDPQGDAAISTSLRVRDVSDVSATVSTDGSATVADLDRGQNGVYEFNAVAGGRYRVWQSDYAHPYTDEMARIYAPDGTLLNETAVGQWANGVLNGQYYVNATVAGRYRVVIAPQGNAAITTTLHVKDVSDVVRSVPTDGSGTDVNLDQGQKATLTFDAVAGKRIRVWQSDYAHAYDKEKTKVYAPDGTLLSNADVGEWPYGVLNGQYFIDPTVTGTYKVVVEPQGDAVISTKLHVKDVSDLVATVPTDGSATDVSLDQGQKASFTFHAEAGQRFRIWQTGYTHTYDKEKTKVYAPDGTLLNDANVGQWAYGVLNGQYYVDPAVTGTYKVVIEPQGDAVISTKLHAQDATDITAAAVTDGSAMNVVLSAGQNGSLYFDAQVGQRFRIWQTDYTFPYTDEKARIYAPDGSLLSEANVGQWIYGVLNGDFTIDPTVAGRYKVVIDPQGDVALATSLHIQQQSSGG